jgi:hypothetical protein
MCQNCIFNVKKLLKYIKKKPEWYIGEQKITLVPKTLLLYNKRCPCTLNDFIELWKNSVIELVGTSELHPHSVVMLCHNYKLGNTKAITHIVEHKLATEHWPISYLFLGFFLMFFSWLWMHQVEGYNTFLNSKGKREIKHAEHKLSKPQNVWIFFYSIFLFIFKPHIFLFSSYLVHFECSKRLWVCQLELYKSSWTLEVMEQCQNF